MFGRVWIQRSQSGHSHDGETRLCVNYGGVSFSWFQHFNSNPTSGDGFSKQIQDRTQVRYEWLPDGPVSGNSRQIFNRGSSCILESSINGIDFKVDLWTDHAGNRTGSDAGDLDVLYVRDDTVVNDGTHLGFDLTHRVSRRFGFTITTADAVIFDEFIFDEAFDMGSVDMIGNATDGRGDVGTFLWAIRPAMQHRIRRRSVSKAQANPAIRSSTRYTA